MRQNYSYGTLRQFPDTEAELRKLPEWTHTAAAVSAIAFGRKATVVDGNVERNSAAFAVTEPLPSSKEG